MVRDDGAEDASERERQQCVDQEANIGEPLPTFPVNTLLTLTNPIQHPVIVCSRQ